MCEGTGLGPGGAKPSKGGSGEHGRCPEGVAVAGGARQG